MKSVINLTKRRDRENLTGRIQRVTAFAAFVLIAIGAVFSISSVASAQHYKKINLVSDLSSMAPVADTNLKNPWGIAHSTNGPWWVANNHTGVATVYDGTGQPFPGGTPLIVNIKSASGDNGPVTGTVFNSTNDFNVVTYKPAAFIFVSEDGSISAWNPDVDPANAILMAHNPNAIYKGVTIANNGGANLLYVANFHESSVDVFDTNFGKVTLNKGAFVDKKIPDGYGPFNVQNIEGKIYVAFAKQSPDKVDEVAGPGLGFVDVFDTSGKLLRRLKHNINLNAPWAIVLAPSDFGKFSGRLLVGNFGSGRIAAYDTNNGNFKGLLRNRRGKPVVSEGLWGLGFGNGDKAGPVNTLFFAAGINDEENGLFGTITPTSKASQEN